MLIHFRDFIIGCLATFGFYYFINPTTFLESVLVVVLGVITAVAFLLLIDLVNKLRKDGINIDFDWVTFLASVLAIGLLVPGFVLWIGFGYLALAYPMIAVGYLVGALMCYRKRVKFLAFFALVLSLSYLLLSVSLVF